MSTAQGVGENRISGPVSVVMAGAGARGAYEAGVLAGLLPILDRCGLRPTMFFGTSAGAINATLFASLAHMPAEDAAREALVRWRRIRKPHVIKPGWQTLPFFGLRYVAAMAGFRGELKSLFDTSPMRASLDNEELLDWPQIHENVLNGAVDAVSVVTTEHGTNRTKVFYESSDSIAHDVPGSDDERALDYVRTTLTPDHVLASAAIPVAFPPVQLGTARSPSWHMDGGVRLNAPLKPAIAFGAARMIVIATDPARYQLPPLIPSIRPVPSVLDATAQILHGVLADRMIEDLQGLMRTNRLAEDSTKSPTGRRYRLVPFIFGGPPNIEDVGNLAGGALAQILQGFRGLLNFDLLFLNMLLSVSPASRPDLISYLLFEPEFIDVAIELGQRHANMILQSLGCDPQDPESCPRWLTTDLALPMVEALQT